jgi:putative endopeptidase
MKTQLPPQRRSVRRTLFTSVVVSACAIVTTSANAVDGSIIDTKADPRVDFVRYANGLWLDKTGIPADRPAVGSFDEVNDALEKNLLAIVKTQQPSADGQKLVALYAQATNIEARNAAGVRPIQKTLNQIRSAKSLKQLFSIDGGSQPITPTVGPSPTDPTRNVLTLGAPTLGLGGRDAYLGTDAGSKAVHQQYIAFLAKQLRLVGYSAEAATRESTRVFALERKVAALLIDPRDLAANFQLANVPVTVQQLKKLTPSADWRKTIALANLAPNDTVILTESPYIKKFDATFRKASLETVKAFTVSGLLGAAGPYLSDEIGSLQFDFFGKVLSGQEQRTPLETRALRQTSGFMADTVGQIYVTQFFSEAAKTEIVTMTNEILTAFKNRITASAWMSPETKAKAIQKVDKVKVRVAYPERFLTFDDVKLGSTYAESAINFGERAQRRELAKVGQPIDQTNWGPVAWVNAFYDPTNNSINFPAGILAGAFFDVKNDPASNFGAIGAVIGHELTHGFDITGSQFDGDGRLVSWWSDADRESFVGLNDRLSTQYSALKVPNIGSVDGKLTVGENVADLGGAQVAFDALNARLAKTQDPGLIDGLTQKQRFFVAWTQVWKSKTRPEFARLLLEQDPHSPDDIRATQPIRNMSSFHEAFGIKDGDPMWLAPADRIVVW